MCDLRGLGGLLATGAAGSIVSGGLGDLLKGGGAHLSFDEAIADLPAALDADSEHEEGKFYVWAAAEVERSLAPRKTTRPFLKQKPRSSA